MRFPWQRNKPQRLAPIHRMDRGATIIQGVDLVRPRAFAGAKNTDITSSMSRTTRPWDGDVRGALRILRARSREEYQSNDYAKHAIRLIKQNVIGPQGIRLQSKAVRQNGNPDKPARMTLEKHWQKWGKKQNCTRNGKRSWKQVQDLFVHGICVDGEAIVIANTRTRRNPYGIDLELVDPELLDIELDIDRLPGGRYIRMGIEHDRDGRVVAYYFHTQESRNDTYKRGSLSGHRRVEARYVLHGYMPEAVVQTRGVPLLATSLLRFNMLRGYEDAELVAARVAASKMGFFIEGEGGEEYEGEAQDEDGEKYMEAAEPGVFGRMPFGAEFQAWDPQHPNTAFDAYLKAVLRGSFAGMGVPYNAAANDPSGVNFSTLKATDRDSQDGWRCWQSLVSDDLHDWVYGLWLDNALLTGVLEVRPGAPLNPTLIEKYLDVGWIPRSWDHPQPKDHAAANELKIKNRVTSISQVIRESGREPADVFEEIAEERQMLADLGVPVNDEATTDEQETDEETGNQNGTDDEETVPGGET